MPPFARNRRLYSGSKGMAINTLPHGKQRGIQPDRFRFRHRALFVICVICEICGLKKFDATADGLIRNRFVAQNNVLVGI